MDVQKNGHKSVLVVKSKINEVDEKIVLAEIKNPALHQLSKSVLCVLRRIQNQDVDKEQALLELAALKQTMHMIAMDWNSRRKLI